MNSTDITFIIQGPVVSDTPDVIRSVRQHFPKSQIIVSTTDTSVPKTLSGYDELVISPDPGGFDYPDIPRERTNNVNRQIINTKAGLERVHTPYAFKLRSDFLLTGTDFLKYFDKYPKFEQKYKVFGHKLLACCFFTRRPDSYTPYPFHPSDLAFFGHTEDVKKLYNIPLMTPDDAYGNKTARHHYRYTAEQYIFLTCLRQNGFQADCRFYDDVTPQNTEQTEHYLASNFIFLDFEHFNLKGTKPHFFPKIYADLFETCYTPNEALRLYQKHLDPSIRILKPDWWRWYFRYKMILHKIDRSISRLLTFFIWNRKIRRAARQKIFYFLSGRTY